MLITKYIRLTLTMDQTVHVTMCHVNHWHKEFTTLTPITCHIEHVLTDHHWEKLPWHYRTRPQMVHWHCLQKRRNLIHNLVVSIIKESPACLPYQTKAKWQRLFMTI